MTWSLATASLAIGGLIALLGLAALLAPGLSCKGLRAFPRNEWSAYALTAIVLIWVGWVILHAPLGRFEWMKPAVYFAAPITFILMVTFLDELLAPRVLGGLLLLLGNPVLNIARWHDSELRLVVAVAVYLWVIAGIILVLSPYRFRQLAGHFTASENRCRFAGFVGTVVGCGFLFLGLKVY